MLNLTVTSNGSDEGLLDVSPTALFPGIFNELIPEGLAKNSIGD